MILGITVNEVYLFFFWKYEREKANFHFIFGKVLIKIEGGSPAPVHCKSLTNIKRTAKIMQEEVKNKRSRIYINENRQNRNEKVYTLLLNEII